jgi:hypothetical protein
VWVVRMTKVVEHRDRLDDSLDGLWPERRHAWRYDPSSTVRFTK